MQSGRRKERLASARSCLVSLTRLSLLGNEMQRDKTAWHAISNQSHTAAAEDNDSDGASKHQLTFNTNESL